MYRVAGHGSHSVSFFLTTPVGEQNLVILLPVILLHAPLLGEFVA